MLGALVSKRSSKSDRRSHPWRRLRRPVGERSCQTSLKRAAESASVRAGDPGPPPRQSELRKRPPDVDGDTIPFSRRESTSEVLSVRGSVIRGSVRGSVPSWPRSAAPRCPRARGSSRGSMAASPPPEGSCPGPLIPWAPAFDSVALRTVAGEASRGLRQLPILKSEKARSILLDPET